MTHRTAPEGQPDAAVPFQITKKMLQSLAPLPATAVQLLALLDDADASLRKIADVAARDVGIAAAILRMANSPVFGVRGRVGNIGEALRLIGTAQARLIVLTWGVASAGQKELRLYGLASGAFMRHSELVATLSMSIAKEVRYADAAMAYSAGLLHDIGKVIINAVTQQSSPGAPTTRPFTELAEQLEAPIVILEQRGVGTDHAAVGRDLAALWALPRDLADAITLHHSRPAPASAMLPAIIDLANAVAGQVDGLYPVSQRVALPDDPVIPPEQVMEMAKQGSA